MLRTEKGKVFDSAHQMSLGLGELDILGCGSAEVDTINVRTVTSIVSVSLRSCL